MTIMQKAMILEGIISKEKRTTDLGPSLIGREKISIRTQKGERPEIISEIRGK